jgi:hypothetical protein
MVRIQHMGIAHDGWTGAVLLGNCTCMIKARDGGIDCSTRSGQPSFCFRRVTVCKKGLSLIFFLLIPLNSGF